LTRRQFVRLTVVGGATLLWAPGCQDAPPELPPDMTPDMTPAHRFLTDEERQALAVFADYVLPPDDQPGGAALGAVDYVEALLTAMEYDPPRLLADGPFSDRNPIPLPDGSPSNVYPDNSFLRFLPLTREQQFSWRVLLYGSAGVSGGTPNDELLGPFVGFRDLCRSGLAQARQLAGRPVAQLDVDEVDTLWRKLPGDFVSFVTQSVLEAAFGAPEYGGNRNLAGWKMIHVEGDVLPLGYSFYDEKSGRYRERADLPVTTKNLGPDPDPMDPETLLHLKFVVGALGGRMVP
jgi:hypothetical protein